MATRLKMEEPAPSHAKFPFVKSEHKILPTKPCGWKGLCVEISSGIRNVEYKMSATAMFKRR